MRERFRLWLRDWLKRPSAAEIAAKWAWENGGEAEYMRQYTEHLIADIEAGGAEADAEADARSRGLN